MRYDRYVTSLDGLPTHVRPPEEVDSFRQSETRECAKARQRSQLGPGAAAWLRARSMDAQRVIPAQEFLYAGRRHLGIEEHLAATCPACGAADTNTRHARLFHCAGPQANQHQPLVHATSPFLKRVSDRHRVEIGASFYADRDLRMDIVIERRGLRDVSASDFRHKNILIDVTYVDPQSGKRGFTCVPGVLTKMDQRLQPLRRQSATTTPALDVCPSTSAAINLSPLRWKAMEVLEGKEANPSISWRRVWSEEGMEGQRPRKASARNVCYR